MDDIMQRNAFIARRFGSTRIFIRPLVGIFTILFLLGLFGASIAPAIEPPQLSSEQLVQVGELLRQGRQIELESRWDDALAHYEKAMRKFPGEPGLKSRFDFTRMHSDVRRRLHDKSFCDSLDRLSLDQALSLYEEVLVRIQSDHVESPQWKDLVIRGLNSFDVALSEPNYVLRFLPHASSQQINAFRRKSRSELAQWTVDNRQEACAAVGWVARSAQQELGISSVAVVFEFNCGAMNSLDVYSAYLTPDQLDEIYSQIEGNFVGLGIELKTRTGQLNIVRVIPHSPAEEAGLHARDRILAINGQDVDSMPTDQAANMLQGVAGSSVELVVKSPGQQPRTIRAQRRRVDVPSIENIKIIDRQRGIGYFKLTCFQKSTLHDLDDALWQLHRDGMRGGLIMDLRGNPGGLLISSVEAVDRFVKEGVIVSTRGRNARETFTYSAHAPGTWSIPLIVLIDHDSASAAEIFAGAIRDHHRGTIIGEQSYGKGSVQGIFPLHSHGSGVRLTTAKFYSPNGRAYSFVGVEPDKVVHTVTRRFDSSAAMPTEDTTLATAVRYARTSLSQPAAPAYYRMQR